MIVSHNRIPPGSTYTTLDQKPLEPSDTHFHQWDKLICIARNNTAIEADIDPALALAGSQLLLEALNRRGRWDRI